jgi:Ca-activated chloride channel family protein
VTVDSPLLLALAPVAALLLALLAWLVRRARLRATARWAPELAASAARRGRAGLWVLAASGLLACIGAAGPRWGRTESQLVGRSLNLAIGIDISRSMLAEDVAPNRLQRAVRESRRLVQDSRGDRLALLAFAGRSYILTPLTLDDGAVSLQLDALDPDVASEGGTDLGAVLSQGRGLLTAAAEGGARVLVVFTDGETHDSLDAAIAAARDLRAAGITLIMVGEGDTLAARIPLRDDRGALLGYKTDGEGQIVRTWRRDAVLRAVADAAGGVLVPGEAADQAGAVHRVLANLERSATRELRREDLTPRAWIFALGALVLLTLQGVLRRGPALALVALTLLPDRGFAQRPSAGDLLLRQGDTSGAAAAYVREAARRPTADTALFNAGTAALARGQFDAARKWLDAATRSLDPGLRFRALYNLGLVALIESRRDTTKRATLEEEAAQRFRDALLLAPASRETKWNLELVTSRTPPSGGGGGGAAPPTPPKTGSPPPRPSGGSSALSQAEAEQILNSVERTERDVRAEQARRRRVAQSSAGKDW